MNKDITMRELFMWVLSRTCFKDYMIIILGKPGPTGKTTLCNLLKGEGYNVIEISEGLEDHVDYIDSINTVFEDHIEKRLIIFLNKKLGAD